MLIARAHTRSICFFDESLIHRQRNLSVSYQKRDQERADRLRALQETSFLLLMEPVRSMCITSCVLQEAFGFADGAFCGILAAPGPWHAMLRPV